MFLMVVGSNPVHVPEWFPGKMKKSATPESTDAFAQNEVINEYAYSIKRS